MPDPSLGNIGDTVDIRKTGKICHLFGKLVSLTTAHNMGRQTKLCFVSCMLA